MKLLTEIDRQIDLIEVERTRERRRLPPFVGAVDRIVGVVVLFRVVRIAVLTVLTLNEIGVARRLAVGRTRTCELTVELGLANALAARGRGCHVLVRD